MENNSGTKRPDFPKRAIVTAGMPYGNKDLHLGHIGGVFIPADTFARFLRDRIGAENVLFISGTDCYGSPIFEHHRRLVSQGLFTGTIEEFAGIFHKKQKETLKEYNISLDFFAASAIEPVKTVHADFTKEFIEKLYTNGHLKKLSTLQFYDRDYNTFLNGRQVIGKCPVVGCSSDKGYADECSLGHQYMPTELINPLSTLSGKAPEMRNTANWYFKLDEFKIHIKSWLSSFKLHPAARSFAVKSIEEFLEPPVIYVKKEYIGLIETLKSVLPEHSLLKDEKRAQPTLFSSVWKTEKKPAVCCRKVKFVFAQVKLLYPSGSPAI